MANQSLPCAVGIDIGGSSIKVGLVIDSGRLLHQRTLPIDRQDVQGLIKVVLEVIKQFQIAHQISSIGIASTGIVDSEQGVILQSTTIRDYDGTNWKSIVSRYYDLPVYVENDVNAAAWGEFKSTSLPSIGTMSLIAIGTGIGCGLIVDGKIWRGTGYAAGEIGYITINVDGPEYNGNVGCLEYYAAAPSIVNYVRERIDAGHESVIISLTHGDRDLISLPIIKQAEDKGDRLAREAFEFAGKMLGVGIVNLVNLFNPRMVILGGGVVDASETYTKAAKSLAMRRILRSACVGLEIVTAQLGNNAAVVGAGLLALDAVNGSM
ncbi:MAG TPA: ROK family protein [Ktedonobacteraceae bacterium]|nr:ROK family protein [Ktedonobacteraceae bacterium]